MHVQRELDSIRLLHISCKSGFFDSIGQIRGVGSPRLAGPLDRLAADSFAAAPKNARHVQTTAGVAVPSYP